MLSRSLARGMSSMASQFVVEPCAPATLAVVGEAARFPVRRVYCVGRNYKDHAVEMEAKQKDLGISKGDQVHDPPFFFQKPGVGAIIDASAGAGAVAKYPMKTALFEFELELVVALKAGGAQIPVAEALDAVYGSALGVDLTRRDLQHAAKATRRPWDAAKGFDDSAPCGALVPGFVPAGDVTLTLAANGDVKQQCRVDQMIFDVAHIIHHLSHEVELKAGDVIFTGTPAGVGPLDPGDAVECPAAAADGGEALPRCAFSVGAR